MINNNGNSNANNVPRTISVVPPLSQQLSERPTLIETPSYSNRIALLEEQLAARDAEVAVLKQREGEELRLRMETPPYSTRITSHERWEAEEAHAEDEAMEAGVAEMEAHTEDEAVGVGEVEVRRCASMAPPAFTIYGTARS